MKQQSTKDRILSETPDEVKQRVRDRANLLVRKQETVEEAAEQHRYGLPIHNFVRGVNWQMERSYSEQDMIDFAYNYTEERKNKGARALTPELLIKQFKKK